MSATKILAASLALAAGSAVAQEAGDPATTNITVEQVDPNALPPLPTVLGATDLALLAAPVILVGAAILGANDDSGGGSTPDTVPDN